MANTDIDASNRAADGVASPISGVVVGWRIKTGGGAFNARPRIVSNNTGVAVGDTVPVPSAAATYQFPARLPIQVGQVVGVDVSGLSPGSSAQITFSGLNAGTFNRWDIALGAGDMGTPTMTNSNIELLVNADVEPDADGDGYGDVTQDACPDVASRHLEPCHDPPPTTGGGRGVGGTGGSAGSSGAGGAPVFAAPSIVPPVVPTPRPLPKPKGSKRKSAKSKRCSGRAKRAHRCPKRQPARGR
jgi:hypothetical protein